IGEVILEAEIHRRQFCIAAGSFLNHQPQRARRYTKASTRWRFPSCSFVSFVVKALLSASTDPPARGRRVLENILPVPDILWRRLRTWHRPRSEEHTSELQSLRHLVCRLLLEKK